MDAEPESLVGPPVFLTSQSDCSHVCHWQDSDTLASGLRLVRAAIEEAIAARADEYVWRFLIVGVRRADL